MEEFILFTNVKVGDSSRQEFVQFKKPDGTLQVSAKKDTAKKFKSYYEAKHYLAEVKDASSFNVMAV